MQKKQYKKHQAYSTWANPLDSWSLASDEALHKSHNTALHSHFQDVNAPSPNSSTTRALPQQGDPLSLSPSVILSFCHSLLRALSPCSARPLDVGLIPDTHKMQSLPTLPYTSLANSTHPSPTFNPPFTHPSPTLLPPYCPLLMVPLPNLTRATDRLCNTRTPCTPTPPSTLPTSHFPTPISPITHPVCALRAHLQELHLHRPCSTHTVGTTDDLAL